MLGNRFAEGPPLLRVGERLLQARAGEPGPSCGDIDASQLQAVQHLLQAAPFLGADQVVGRHPAVIEHELGRVYAAVAGFVHLRTTL